MLSDADEARRIEIERDYRRQVRKDVLRLRSLVSRGRAKVRRTRTADPIPDRVFRLPNELAWHVLQFWRATDAAGEVL